MEFYILSLNPGYDRWALIDAPSPLSRVIRAGRAFWIPAGKGINVARALVSLGHESLSCFAPLGGNLGRLIAQGCEQERIPLVSYPIASESRMNHTSVRLYNGEIFTVNEEGPSVSPEEVQGMKDAILSDLALRPASVLTLCGTACPGFAPESLAELLQEAKSLGHPLAVDVGGRFLVPATRAQPEILKINREEFALAFHFDGWERSPELLSWLADTGVQTLILTDGANGACAHRTEESLYASLPDACGGPYSVGSGDSFFGGCLYAWSQGLPLADLLRWGNACGVVNTRAIRCGGFPRQEVEAALPLTTLL